MTREAIAALTQDDLLEIINQRADDILIWVHHTTGGTRGYLLTPVVSNTGTVVDVADGLAIAADDSD